MKENVVRVYDSSGTFAYAIGRAGAGPGEFKTPISATFSADSLLWVRDEGNHRINAYALEPTRATFRTSVRYDHAPSGPNRIEPIPIDAAGRIVSIGRIADSKGGYQRARFIIDRAGTVIRVDTIANPPPDSIGDRSVARTLTTAEGSGAGVFYYYEPYGPTFITAHSLTGAMARTVTSRYDIEWFGSDGKPLRTIRRAVEGPALSDSERKRGQERIDGFLKRAGVSASTVPALASRKTPIRHIAFDSMGQLWVERSVADGAPREADLYDTTGHYVAVLRWAPEIDLLGLQLVAASGARVLGVAVDSLGVTQVVRLRF
jgi:hypothetical protein